jgi:cysteinyl-tRNA synthetase
MNYTDMYRKVYAELKNNELSHEEVHKSAISICEAITNLYVLSNTYVPSVLSIITEIIEDLNQSNLDISS